MFQRPITQRLKTLAVLLAVPCAVQAADGEAGPQWAFGGFGSLGAVHSSQRHADFTANPLIPGQAGFTHPWSMDVDSRLGAQLTVNPSKQWSAVVQVVSERTVHHDFRPHIEWANVKYQATPDLSLRFGRIALPLFLAADYRKASYALPWVRPPVELYSSLPVSSSDGVDVGYRWTAAGVKQETQLMYGATHVRVGPGSSARAHGVRGISHTASQGDLSVRATLMAAQLALDEGGELVNALGRFGSAGAALGERYSMASKRITAFSMGFNYDPGHWFLMGEFGRFNARSLLGDRSAWYLSSGRRWGAFTPYLTYARVGSNTPTSVPGIPLQGLARGVAAQAATVNNELNRQLHTIAEQHSAIAGLRWDFASHAALKLEHGRVRPLGGTQGTLINIQPGFQSGKTFGVSSVVVDFVF
ncbi:hypothetical protein [Massilia endophytica]|uniref:hypothetical protein n=1 Tax=Massilia endophytica TaxID=2899220 RepID=UPI001E5DD2F9|nr:hypothetical protein [Massilia endophytica]UGQ48194.1 hypothetical protein LSQ66_06935 [Massilia endophytica]